MNVPIHFWADIVSITCFLINRMPSSVFNWATPYHQLFPNNPLFPIDPKVFECTCFVRDVCSQVSKLDSKSLKCIFVGYSRVQIGYRCYCPPLRRYFVSTDVAVFEITSFSLLSTVVRQGEEEDLLVYTLASPIISPEPTSVPAQVKPPITQVYTWRRQQPPVSSLPLVALTLDLVLSDGLPIALRKGRCQCAHPGFRMSRYIGDILSIFRMAVDSDTISGIDNQLSEKSKKIGQYRQYIADISVLHRNIDKCRQ